MAAGRRFPPSAGDILALQIIRLMITQVQKPVLTAMYPDGIGVPDAVQIQRLLQNCREAVVSERLVQRELPYMHSCLFHRQNQAAAVAGLAQQLMRRAPQGQVDMVGRKIFLACLMLREQPGEQGG